MKTISFFATPKTALSANEMKQLKGGGNCGYLQDPSKTLFGGLQPMRGPQVICGLTEEEAIQYSQNDGGPYCCNNCSSRSDRLSVC